jgi:predicted phage terminase large subunit-like protein
MQLSDVTFVRAAITRERAQRSLHYFLEHIAWPALNGAGRFDQTPTTPFVDNWHLHALCEHLQAVHLGQILKLLVNMPGRTLKSTILSQTFPAWEWTTKPHLQYLTSSYAKALSMRDALATRTIIESQRYQSLWGKTFLLKEDQNAKSHYLNDKGGSRIITSTDSATIGLGGNRVMADDPNSVVGKEIEASNESSINHYKDALISRRNNAKTDALIVSQQRTDANDLTGYILRTEDDWCHLVLSMRFRELTRKITSLGFRDPRTMEGELLHPERIDESTVKSLEKVMGSHNAHAQLDQDPDDADSSLKIFPRKHWKFYKVLPQLNELVISLDCSFKDKASSDPVAIQVWGANVGEANTYLIYRKRDKLSFSATVKLLETVAAKYPKATVKLVEDKANGTAVIDTLKDTISGMLAIEPEGGKKSRAFSCQGEHEAGNMHLPHPDIDPDIEEFINEHDHFPSTKYHDDEVDAQTQYHNWRRNRVKKAESYIVSAGARQNISAGAQNAKRSFR